MFCTVLCGVRSESLHSVLVQSSQLLVNNSTSSLRAGVFESFSAMLLPSDREGNQRCMLLFPLRSSCIGADEMKNRFVTSQCQEEVWLVAIELWGLFTPNETTFSTAADYIRSNHQTGQSSSRSWKTLDFNHNRIISNQKGGGDIKCYSTARNFDFELKCIHHSAFSAFFNVVSKMRELAWYLWILHCHMNYCRLSERFYKVVYGTTAFCILWLIVKRSNENLK